MPETSIFPDGGDRRSRAIPVVMVHFNAPEWCAASVASILASEGVRPEITIIDNGGLDADLGGAVSIVRVGVNAGYAGGANIGLGSWLETSDRYCVLCSHDVIVDPECLIRLVEQADVAPRYGVLGPAGLPPDRPGAVSYEPVLPAEWVSGTLLLLRRECVLDVGPLDERFHSYVEDVDFCLRARDCGWDVGVVTSAVASHRGSSSSQARARTVANRHLLTTLRSHGLARLAAQVRMVGCLTKAVCRLLYRSVSERDDRRDREFVAAWVSAMRGSMRRSRSRSQWPESRSR